MHNLRAIELFAGGGGLMLGTSLAGFDHIAAVEWEHNCCETLRLNQSHDYPLIGDAAIIESDVRAVDWSFAPDDLDLLAGGPPCQPFSLGGLARAALDPRDMFPAYTEILSTLHPRAFIVENVKGLTRESFRDYYDYILMRLQHPLVKAREDETWRDHAERLSREHTAGIHDELRYEVVPTVVDAADYGVAQRRHRVIMVGFRSDVEAKWSFPRPTHSQAALFDAQQEGRYWRWHGIRPGEGIKGHLGNPSLRPWRTVRDALVGLPDPHRPRLSAKFLNHDLREGAKTYAGHTGSPLDEPSKAIKAGVHGVPGGENMMRFPDGSVRYYTVREAARVQGFPDGYEFSGSWGEGLRQIGNAVPVELARVIASSVAIALHEDAARKAMDSALFELEAEHEAA